MRMRYVLLTGLCFLCACTSARKQEGFFVTKIGDDTIAVESYQTDAMSVQGTSVALTPKTTMRHYSMTLNKDGLPESFSISLGPAAGESQITRNYRFANNSVEIVTTQNGTTKSTTANVAGHPFPFFANIFGIWDYAIRHTLETNGGKQFSTLSGNRALSYKIQGTPPGKLELLNTEQDFGPLFATVDSNNTLQQFDLTPTTDKYIAHRVQNLDVQAVATNYAAREQSGKGIGVLSPRDTARAVINGATVLIDYSRPEMRGRVIFGNVVPWDVVWRLGANAATQMVTDKRLAFGRTIVLPGRYSLFAYPSEKGWKLIINNQHGQWGTAYDASKDLARLSLKTEHLKDTVEQFTFGIERHRNGGVLSFKWENTEASIPFSVR